ncbi:UNVERIFIED_CONTAM: hypothetical protein GTU68_004602 [Idotea baltica]|nr:hypothetical protein [Idotea baltica]
MRPRTLDEYVGQQHILGEGKLLRRAVEADRFTSLIFYGPPGVGKTSLAELIAQRTDSRFVNLSGVESNVAEIRSAVQAAKGFQRTRKQVTTLFVDEIHRFNKSQQDVLLPHIERGTVRFIGATTHNPFFYINSPLVSRSQDTISAFIKSMRGSDPDAALYWLAKMLYAGEDIRFISRRIVIAASEDIGMADSNALRVAVAAHQAVELLGMPEARIPLAHAAVYLATAPKSNRSYAGINAAMKDVQEGRTLAVPPHLRTKSRKKLGVEGGAIDSADTAYKYGHEYEGGYVPQAYLPEGRRYYEPSENGLELRVKERLEYWRQQFEAENAKL